MYVPIPTMSALRVFNELLLIFVMCNKVTSIKSVVFKCFEANYYDFYRVFPQMMAPNFHQAAIDLEPYVRLAKLDTENEQQLAGQIQHPQHSHPGHFQGRARNRSPKWRP
jgi:hypothetical protein